MPPGGRHQFSGEDRRHSPESRLAGLDLLASAVVLLDARGCAAYMNLAAEQLFEISWRLHATERFSSLFVDGAAIDSLLGEAISNRFDEMRTEMALERPGHGPLELQATAVPVDAPLGAMMIEFREIDHRHRLDRGAQLLGSAEANRELVRNLAHEIKNPLGGLRGAAQLLELELDSPDLREYTQVIIKEADRLQALVDRLLTPHRKARQLGPVNIHEVCERVRIVVQAEFPDSLEIRRDYDASLPDFTGDKEQLIQVLLNLVHNAAQAMGGRGVIELRTRIARQVPIDRKVIKLALELHVIDNGPGIPEDIRERVFFPLVSGRDGGSGLGLSIAQTFVQQHGGLIDCESRPGRTDFRVLLPLA
ncbi:MAG: nitrogen regulation protein NR(II) [Pseudomonadota bacterium]|nr:nitrogen regulation protein NR(II) [Pseudomonadota bacterium]